LYFHIPAISKGNEYYALDLGGASAGGTANLSQASSAFSDAVGILVGAAEPKWFEEDKNAAKLRDDSTGRRITMLITEKNVKAVNELIAAKQAEIADKLQAAGILSAADVESWKQADGKQRLEIKSPGKLGFVIDGQGFIREQEWELSISLIDKDGKSSTHDIAVKQAYDQLNQSQTFSMEVPKEVKSFDEILKLLNPKK